MIQLIIAKYDICLYNKQVLIGCLEGAVLCISDLVVFKNIDLLNPPVQWVPGVPSPWGRDTG